jgi:4-hydroxyphenylacetate 3-monooxygenase
MTRSGAEYTEAVRDARKIYVDGEVVRDVTRHPGFAGAARTVAEIYDLIQSDTDGELTFPSPTTRDPVSRAWMIPRSYEDLVERRKALKRISERSYGLIGRGPEHVASFLSAFASSRDVFDRGGREFGENVVRFYEEARDNSWYVSYVIVPPQIDRSRPAHQQEDPHLYAGVVGERDGGIVIRGAQMLGTGAALSDFILLSCIHPLRPGDEAYAISVAVPTGADGVRLISRRPYAAAASSSFDYPLTTRFDEGDYFVVFNDVFVPWERVFIYRDVDLVRAQFFETGAHMLGNSQAQIRFWTKLEFIVGLASSIARMNRVDKEPAVQQSLGQMAAHAAMVEGLVRGQEAHCEIDRNGMARPGRAELYANMTFQSQIYPTLLNMLRDLSGGGMLQLPSSAADFSNPEAADAIAKYIQSPGVSAQQRVKLLKLAWDMVGSEFASRHHQYEMFYAGAPHMVKGFMYRNYDFEGKEQMVRDALEAYDIEPADPLIAAPTPA